MSYNLFQIYTLKGKKQDKKYKKPSNIIKNKYYMNKFDKILYFIMRKIQEISKRE